MSRVVLHVMSFPDPQDSTGGLTESLGMRHFLLNVCMQQYSTCTVLYVGSIFSTHYALKADVGMKTVWILM